MLLYVRDNIPFKVLDNTDFGHESEAIFVEITIRKTKWLISCSYNPHTADIKTHLKVLGENLDLQSSKNKIVLLWGISEQNLLKWHLLI